MRTPLLHPLASSTLNPGSGSTADRDSSPTIGFGLAANSEYYFSGIGRQSPDWMKAAQK